LRRKGLSNVGRTSLSATASRLTSAATMAWLSAILASSATAFSLVKYAGAAYLVYLGLMALLQRPQNPAPAGASHPLPAKPRSLGAIFWQGFCCNALNSKVALFFLAFVPQFISLDSPDKPLAFVVLGLIFDVNSMLWCHLLVLITTRLSQRLRVSGSLRRWLGKSIGALFVSLGVKLALTTQG